MKLSDFYKGDEEIIVSFFYGELKGVLETIRRRVFNGKVEYDEMVSEFYLFLAQDNWRRVRTFDARNGCSLKTWMSRVAWRFFVNEYVRLMMRSRQEKDADNPCLPASRITNRIDLGLVLASMPNRRYAEAVSLLVIIGCEPKLVAELWHTNVSNVYNIRHRAINQFRECYLSSAKEIRIG